MIGFVRLNIGASRSCPEEGLASSREWVCSAESGISVELPPSTRVLGSFVHRGGAGFVHHGDTESRRGTSCWYDGDT